MSKFIRPKHLPAKRGKVVENLDIATGTLKRYSSGYIEHVDKEGLKTDVLWDLHRRRHEPRTWKCMRTNGGGIVDYDHVTRSEAMEKCSRELGAVLYSDDHHGFIFYRDRDGSIPSTQTPIK